MALGHRFSTFHVPEIFLVILEENLDSFGGD
jgi:hypothetical protein